MSKRLVVLEVLVITLAVLSPQANAQPVTGAIFTTVADGSEVNFNIYADKNDVYLDGGPGPGAPQTAAGLPDGIYVFMVTDPSGKTLLSTDIAACRRFQVTAGIITGLVVDSPTCTTPHVTGVDVDHGAITVQLMPYNDTPNNGGEYKVWASPVGNFLCPLTAVDCSKGTHGFVNQFSKTDNYKVKIFRVREIDTRFLDTNHGNAFIDGMMATWIDTNGASNNKWSYYNQALDVNHEAHVEAPENGTHQIVIQSQTGCTVGDVYLAGSKLPNSGPQAVTVKMLSSYKNITIFVDVYCN